jgi:hypothetical protein
MKEYVQMGEISLKIPKNETALAILASNPQGIVNGASFEEDGWIYIDGKRIKKWFTTISSDSWSGRTRIWEPILKDVASLEQRYQRMRERRNKFWYEKFVPAFKAVVEKQIAYAQPTRAPGKWWKYYSGGESIGFDWLDEKPANPENLDIGQHYYEMDRRMMRYRRYFHKFRIALERAIGNILRDNKPDKDNLILRLTINGRSYWYVSGYNGYTHIWTKMAWPEDEIIEVTV